MMHRRIAPIALVAGIIGGVVALVLLLIPREVDDGTRTGREEAREEALDRAADPARATDPAGAADPARRAGPAGEHAPAREPGTSGALRRGGSGPLVIEIPLIGRIQPATQPEPEPRLHESRIGDGAPPPGVNPLGRQRVRAAAPDTGPDRRRYRATPEGERAEIRSGGRRGPPRIRLPDRLFDRALLDGPSPVRATVCVGAGGRPEEVRIEEGTGHPEVDDYIARRLLAEPYRPRHGEGKRPGYCERLTLVVVAS